MKTILPLRDLVLLEPLAEADTTAGGIYVPYMAREDVAEATVVDVGDADTIKVAKGDRVFFHKKSGVGLTIGGRALHLLKYDGVLAKVIQ